MPAATKTTKLKATALVVERGHLIGALAQVMPVVPNKGSLPVLTGVRLTMEGERLRVTATNLEIWVSLTIPADGPSGFDAVVPARMLQRLVREASGDIRLECVTGDLTDLPEVNVSWGRSVAKLQSWPDRYPDRPVVTGKGITLNANDIDLLRRVANFASTDDCRPILTAICVGGARNAFVATDSYRLSIAETEARLPKRKPFLLQARVTRFLPPRMLKSEKATLRTDDRWAAITVGDLEIHSTLIEGGFPPYATLIPQNVTAAVTFNRDELTRAVRAAGVMAGDATPVRIELGDAQTGGASILTATQDVGQLATDVDVVNVTGYLPPSTCAFNPKYLGELLHTCNADTVTLELVDALKPATVREGPWTLLIMPVRVS